MPRRYEVDPQGPFIWADSDFAGITPWRQTDAEIAAGVTPTNYAYATTPALNVLRYSGVTDDGVTDCTTPLLTAMNAIGGTFIIPRNVIYNRKTLLTTLDTDVLIIDYSQVNDYTAAGETTKRVGIIASDTSTNDSAWFIDSGHHPGLTQNNFGTAGTSSATNRVASIDWAAGHHTNQGLTKRGDRFAAYHHFSKESSTTWHWRIGSIAPWAAINAEYEFWITAEVISGAGVYRSNAAKHYVSTGSGTTGGSAPVHTTGTVSDGGVSWTYVDDYDRNVLSIDQFGRVLFGSGAFTYQWNYIGTQNDPDGGQVAVNWQASGISHVVKQFWTPTNAGGTAAAVPFMFAQDGVGLRWFNSAQTQELLRHTESGGLQVPSASFSVAESATAPVIVNGNTITTAATGSARVAPGGAVTGIILQSGTVAGQTITVVNESAAGNTVTFAVAGTSHVADGVGTVIAGLRANRFIWDSVTTLWYRC